MGAVNTMKADELMGRWISFLVEPGSAGMLVPNPGRARACGEVIGVKPMANCQPGNVPTAAVTVRGRSGRTMVVDFSACFARVHATQAEAVAATKEPTTVPLCKLAKPFGTLADGATVWRCDDGATYISNP